MHSSLDFPSINAAFIATSLSFYAYFSAYINNISSLTNSGPLLKNALTNLLSSNVTFFSSK